MKISADKVVTFHYTLTNGEQQQLDSSYGAEPLPYLHGHHNIVPGLEKALEGLEAGEKLQVTVHPDEGYGRRDNGLVQTIRKADFGDAELEVGMHFEVEDDEGQQQLVQITAIEGDEVSVDGNHPLAGYMLTFDVEIMSVRNGRDEELAEGRPA
ncbi:MAG: peptidylprolyl isomerase [Marinobacterium sp.]|nr:peptidylprolyl isomerase [Marinobacterium sp.]